jgi:hypothetical protein
MKAIFQKIKSFYALINRGILKVADWMTQSFRIGLVLFVAAYAIGIVWFVFYADKVSLEKSSLRPHQKSAICVCRTSELDRRRLPSVLPRSSRDAARVAPCFRCSTCDEDQLLWADSADSAAAG